MNVVNNKWIGQRTIRPDGVDKVTGRAAYGADVALPGMVWGKVLRSPYSHARILSIDTSAAEALPGVKAIITAADLVDYPIDGDPVILRAWDLRYMSRVLMAREKALFHGHPVAAVAATSEAIAEEACALIRVDYEVLPFAVEIDDALKPDAPLVNDGYTIFEGKPSNIATTMEFKHGDVDEGFRQAEIVIERSFTSRPVHQGYIEPQACTVSVSADGKATVYSSSQGHFLIRGLVAAITGIPQSQVRCFPLEIGGGFGGKLVAYIEPLAVALSRKSGLPVKMTMTRDEVMRTTGPGAAAKSTVKIGASREGKILAVKCEHFVQSGCAAGAPLKGVAGSPFACYDIPHFQSVGYGVLTNTTKVAAYRAPGGPQAHFVAESLIDELAETLGMDPIELRMKNAAHEGTLASHGVVFPKIGYIDTLEAARAHPHYSAPLGKFQGRGVASSFWFNSGGQSSAQINITEDGNVVVTTGHPDIGGNRASVANITAELLGVDHASVSVVIGDTQTVGYSDVTSGSRALFVAGKAVTQAAGQVIASLCERAAKIWDISPDAVIWRDGAAHPAGPNAGSFPPLTLADLARTITHGAAPIGANAQIMATGSESAFATHICDVEVDPELGTVKVIRYTAIHDVGHAIHPDYVEGQIHGGVAQGIGWALNEEYMYNREGKIENAIFLDYRIPVCSDLPMIDTVVLEIPNPNHPQGIKGIGEAPILGPIPAVLNAIHNAVGKRLYDLPAKPSRILGQLSVN